jgi:uncharacterized membrane protein YccC
MSSSLFDVSPREAIDTARLAIQSAVAAAAMFALMQVLGLPEKFVGVLSAVLVVQPSVGNTLGEAMNRVVATVVGSVIGIACLWLVPGGYGTAAALALAMLLFHTLTGLRPEWRYGVVAAIALALGSEQELLATAKDRALAIGLGALIGAMSSVLVWPDSASQRARRSQRLALRATVSRMDAAVDSVEGDADPLDDDARRRYQTNIARARSAARGIRMANSAQVKSRIEWTERLYNSVLFLERVARSAQEGGNSLDPALDRRVDAVRSRVREVAEALCEGKPSPGGRLDEAREDLGQAVRSVSGAQGKQDEGDEGRRRVIESALVFALGEVEESLRQLVQACDSD